MDFELRKQKILSDELCQELSAQQNIETSITLPDYCGDIKKILRCTFRPGIANLSLSGEMISAVGKVDIRLIYVNDSDKIDCYESQLDLSVACTAKDLPENPVFTASAKTNYVNCRATSQRKISVEGNVAVLFKVYCRKENSLVLSARGKGVQCREKQVSYENLICRKEKVFDLGETAKVPQGKATVGKILNVSARATLQSKKAVADKLLIKGDLYTEILYLSENEEGKVDKLTHSMPISQIVDISGIDENSLCNVSLGVRQIAVQRKADSSSQGALLEIGAKCSAMVRCSSVVSVNVSDDCYSTGYDLQSDYSIQEFACPVYSADEQKTSVCVVEMPSEISRVLQIWCSDLDYKMSAKGDAAKADCKASLCILYLDSKNTPCFAEKNADYEIKYKLKDSYENLRCESDLQIREIEWKITAKDKLELQIKTGINLTVMSCESIRALKDVKILGKKKISDDAALTLYFGCENEKLWDIAKKYNTTMEAIQNENAINGDVTEKDGMLLIPCVG